MPRTPQKEMAVLQNQKHSVLIGEFSAKSPTCNQVANLLGESKAARTLVLNSNRVYTRVPRIHDR